MPIDSQLSNNYSNLEDNICNNYELDDCSFLNHEEISCPSENIKNLESDFIISRESSSILNGNEQNGLEHHLVSVRPKVLSDDNLFHQKPSKQTELNKWRRVIGFIISGNELKSAIMPRKFSHKLRFAQAKQKLSQLCSYFSITFKDCDEGVHIAVGVSRKDFPSTSELGIGLGSVAYYSETGRILSSSDYISSHTFYKGDIIGCGIIFPSYYKRYMDLSPDDSSDGMTDVVLSSLLNVNKKSMDFVQHVLGLKLCRNESSSDDDDYFVENNQHQTKDTDIDDYNENYVESRKEVEVYFTLNMKIVGKISTCVPVGGFYPTVQILTPGNFSLHFDDKVTL